MQFNNSKNGSKGQIVSATVPEATLEKASEIVRGGGLIAYPTETFYGLGASIDHQAALERLAQIKARPGSSPLSLIVASLAMAKPLYVTDEAAQRAVEELTDELWPGAMTLVLPARPGVHSLLVGPSGGVAIRISSHPASIELARRVGAPITATSANRRGEPPPTHPDELGFSDLRAELDFVLEAGETPGGRPSTILELRGGTVVLIRPGAMPLERIAGVARKVGLATDWTSRP